MSEFVNKFNCERSCPVSKLTRVDPSSINPDLTIFHNFVTTTEVTIGEIIRELGWGSHRVIRQQGFRILPLNEPLKPIKQWNRVTDPSIVLINDHYIAQPKGQSICVIHVHCQM